MPSLTRFRYINLNQEQWTQSHFRVAFELLALQLAYDFTRYFLPLQSLQNILLNFLFHYEALKKRMPRYVFKCKSRFNDLITEAAEGPKIYFYSLFYMAHLAPCPPTPCFRLHWIILHVIAKNRHLCRSKFDSIVTTQS